MENCSKNGVKRLGESCTLNNNCLYPNCLKNNIFPLEELKAQKEKVLNKKLAEKWAEEYLNSEEGKKETEKLNKEAMDYILYGKPTSYLNEQLLDEIRDYEKP